MKLASLLLISSLTINLAHTKDKHVYSYFHEFIFRDAKMTWKNARDDCKRSHAELVKINSTAITNIIVDNFLDGSDNLMWTGATDRKTEGDWIWLDSSDASFGSSTSYVNWLTKPDNWKNIEHCAYVNGQGKWGDVRCSWPLKFICQKVLPATVTVRREDHIFTIQSHVNRTFLNAERACADWGERLVEIYDEGTDAFIRKHLKRVSGQRKINFFIGGTVTNGNVTWRSGTLSTYTSWHSEFPKSTDRGKIYITATLDGWKNTKSNPRPYICEKVHMTRVTLDMNLQTVDSGEVSEINCTGNGIPRPKVYWTDSSVNVTEQVSSVYQTRSPGFSILHVRNALFTDEKTYTCIAINATGRDRTRVERSFSLTVSSSPEYLKVDVENCSSNLRVVWRPNQRALNIPHWFQFKTDDDRKVFHETHITPTNAGNRVYKLTVKPWSMFSVTVMPCLLNRDQCNMNYTVINHTRHMSVGLPKQVLNLDVSKSNSNTCYIRWERPANVPVGYIQKYKIYINGSTNWVYPGKLRNETSFSDVVTNDNTTYEYSGKPNFIYQIGVQAYTCAGPGNISWHVKNCTTDFEGSLYRDLYELTFRTVKKSWQDANMDCEKANATLIKIDSKNVTDLIKRWTNSWWIGASYRNEDGTWRWLDGTSASNGTSAHYEAWSNDEPNHTPNKDCVKVRPDGLWRSVTCNEKIGFICQKTFPLTANRENRIFTFHRQNRLDFDDANRSCADSGERLIEIYDKETDEFIRENIMNRIAQFHIGGTVEDKIVTWQSRTKSSYIKRAPGYANSRKAGYITATVFGWKHINDKSKKLPYICEKSYLSKITLFPNNATVNSGATNSINCSGNGIPHPTVYWIDSTTNVTQTVDTVYQTPGPGFSVLHVRKATLFDETKYTCVAVNAAGGNRTKLKRTVTLTVPSSPEYLKVDVENCSSNLTVIWRANHRALNIAHRIEIRKYNESKVVHKTHVTPSTTENQIHTQTVRPWSMFTVTVMPCLQNQDRCKTKYMLSNHTRRMSVGLPQQVTDLNVSKSNPHTCYIGWEKPAYVPVGYIVNYKIFINESTNWVYAGELRNETSCSDFVTNDNTYNYSGKPNSIYQIGVQAYTCAGPGNISWYAKNCTTDFEGPLYLDLYELTFHTAKNSWQGAKKVCEKTNTALIKIDSENLTGVIKTWSNRWWIGASYRKEDGTWRWLDGTWASNGTSAHYQAWSTDEPNHTPDKDCVIVRPNGKWKNVSCSNKIGFICQKAFPLTANRGDHIFTFHRQKRLNFDDANRSCADSGERLIEIYDKETDEFIRENIMNRIAQFHIGGTVEDKIVTWQSRTKSSYIKWAPEYANSPKTGYITATVFGWKHINDKSKKLPYICEKSYLSKITLFPNNATVNSGATNSINCSGNGIPHPTVYWIDSTANITRTGNTVYQKPRPGFSILHIRNATLFEEKTYTCVAVNAAGGNRTKLQRTVTLTVPSSPEYLKVYVENCSSNLIVVWKPNHRALNISHRLQIKTDNGEQVVHARNVTPATADNQVHNLTVRPWSKFTVTVMPCLQKTGECNTNYMVTDRARHMSVGLPQQVTNISVSKSNSNTCDITWEKPTNVPVELITKYKIFINGITNWVYAGEQRNKTSFSDFVTKENNTYNYSGKPNSIYRIGVQAYTCAGPGNISWYPKSCTTDFEGSLYLDAYVLRFRTVQKSWQGAKEECENANMTLIKIDSAKLTDIIKRWPNRWWIGATDQKEEGTWRWLDGTSASNETFTHQAWLRGQPNANHNKDCGIVNGNGFWKAVKCNRKFKFICQKAFPVTLNRGNHVFTLRRENRLNFEGAKIACANASERLIEIYDEKTDEFIRKNVMNPKTQFHIGAAVKDGIVKWQSKTASSYTRWSPKYPNNSGAGYVTTTISGWKKIGNKSKQLPYICEKEYLSELTFSPNNETVKSGATDEINCTGNGIPHPTVYWIDSTANITQTVNTVYQTPGPGFSILYVRNATVLDEKTYTCVGFNAAGANRTKLERNVTLTVPSYPEYVGVSTGNCSSNLTIFWRPNIVAINSPHRLRIKNENDKEKANETFVTPNTTDIQLHSQIVRPWSTYAISVTPCSQQRTHCKEKYTRTNRTRYISAGLPQQVTNLRVTKSDSYTCSVTWRRPADVPIGHITQYKIVINESSSLAYLGMQRNDSSFEHFLGDESVTYNLSGKPNSIYRIGVQASTCAGPGHMTWYKGSCTTDNEVSSPPEHVANTAGICSSKLNVEWKPNLKAVSLIHKLLIRNDQNESDVYETFVNATTPDFQMHTKTVRPWSTYTISLTPCLQEGKQCNAKYTLTNKTRYMSVGLPPKVSNLRFTQSNSTSCTAAWAKPPGVPVGYITRYKIVINENSSESSPGLQRRESIFESFLSNNSVMYEFARKQNSIYEIGVQAYTCMGPGDISFSVCNPDLEGGNGAVIGGVVVGVAFIILLIAAGAYWILVRRKRNNTPNRSMELNVVEPISKSATGISMDDFERKYNLMQCNNGKLFKTEFEDLKLHSSNLQSSTEFAANPALKVKNRFKNILPYDTTRVHIGNNDDGYINACYINGYRMLRKFIATQGPLKRTVNDFWLMVVEQESVVIVMLAKCIEAGKAKCEKYWPEYGESVTFGKVYVTNVNEVKYSGFVCRTLSVKFDIGNGYSERNVTQYHFLKWPDHGFPNTTSYILRMYQQAIETHERDGPESPIIVHCSAGVGRTGTFIAYDILLNGSKVAYSADAFQCIAKLRSQRVDMVQNCDQYILVHKLLLESQIFGVTDVSRQAIVDSPLDDRSRAELIAEQFSNLTRVKPMDMTVKQQVEKISAYERQKVKYFEDGFEIIHPLRASYLEVYDDSMQVIVTRAPQQGTAAVFYKLLFNFDVTAIVAITESEHESFAYWNASVCGGVSIQVENEEASPYFVTRDLIITNDSTKSQRTVAHIEIRLNSVDGKKKKITRFNEGVAKLQKEHRKSGGNTVVHCKDGKGMSGVFCAVMNLLERLKAEDRIDVFRTVKDLRDCKEEMVSTEEQYGLCYEAVVEYLHNFDTYMNFA